jgi:uncharacterized cupin superfamily protein
VSFQPPETAMPKPVPALLATDIAPRTRASSYPPPFAARVTGREKSPLGDAFGLINFGVNLTRLKPGAQSALRHAHSLQDEFVYILEGAATLATDVGETVLAPGMCAGFKAGTGNAHCLINTSDTDVVYLELGDRTKGDTVAYPDDDIAARMDADGHWHFVHKDGTPY